MDNIVSYFARYREPCLSDPELARLTTASVSCNVSYADVNTGFGRCLRDLRRPCEQHPVIKHWLCRLEIEYLLWEMTDQYIVFFRKNEETEPTTYLYSSLLFMNAQQLAGLTGKVSSKPAPSGIWSEAMFFVHLPTNIFRE